MLFNSIAFLIFLPLVFLLYWCVFNKKLKYQNLYILIISYIFYGWWDWRFLLLIAFSSMLDFIIGLLLKKEKSSTKRKLLLALSLTVNLGFLGFFKYYNFFIENFIAAMDSVGVQSNFYSLQIILPVGISFYTFQTLSYTIDIYRNRLEPSKSWIQFFAYVSFFPQLVAGPIERASNLLPQFYKSRVFNYKNAVLGSKQILWGFFKKIVLADSAAVFVNQIFDNSAELNGSTLFIGLVFFAFQIYGDFSGYSDIAIGTAKLFGFNLMQNFAYPYFSRDIAEFWRRWHISLSTWFRDYLYIPLGGSKGGTLMKIRNTFIIFIVSGFWHGANWTFVFWGFLNALFFIPLLLSNKNRNHMDVIANDSLLPKPIELLRMLLTFVMISLTWVFFRADSMSHAFNYLFTIFSPSLIEIPTIFSLKVVFAIVIVLTLEYANRRKKFGLDFENLNKFKSYGLYYFLILMIIYYSLEFKQQGFIYFQF
ncbi:MBOAT family protein [Flavobacteriaceae bacterium]|nr:MBOAT family protein [Flavobacteriaceae bacterium]